MRTSDSVSQADRAGLSARIALPYIVFIIDIYVPVVFHPSHDAMGRRIIGVIVFFVIERDPDFFGDIGHLPVPDRLGDPVLLMPAAPTVDFARSTYPPPSLHFLL